MEGIYSISIEGQDGRYMTCVDDLEHIGDWLLRTLIRLNAERPLNCWRPAIANFTKV